MKKYRLLRFGHCYITRDGDFTVALLRGSKKKGYQFKVAHVCPQFLPDTIQLLSRIVPNDGKWVEITPQDFVVAYHVINQGNTVKMMKAPVGASIVSCSV